MAPTLTLNERAQRLADHFAMNAAQHRIRVLTTGNGARILNCGIDTPGGLQAGLTLARVCLANHAEVTLVPGEVQEAGLIRHAQQGSWHKPRSPVLSPGRRAGLAP